MTYCRGMASDSWATSPGTRASMLGNRPANTKPETALRSALHAAGLRFRKNFRIPLGGLLLRPDVVFTRPKVAVFVDGCFWHSCPVHGTRPKRNADYWTPKLERNVARDRANDEALRNAGWTVLRIWEHVPASDAAQAVMAAVECPASDGARPAVATGPSGSGSRSGVA